MKVDAVLDLSAAEELSQIIAAGGGTMSLAAGDNINLSLPGDLSNLLPRLKEHKPELVALLREAGLPEPWCQTFITADNGLAEQLAIDPRVAFLSFVKSML